MKILGQSLSQAAGDFLHAGYISAYPHGYYGSDWWTLTPDPKIQLEVAEALRLKGEAVAAGGLSEPVSSAVGVLGTGWSWEQLLAGLLLLLSLGALAFAVRRVHPRRQAVFSALLLLFGLVLPVATCGDTSSLPEDPPWVGVGVQEYEMPELATRTLMHGIITPAVANMDEKVSTLANIQNEVGLPEANLTAGEAYALLTYGRDGWGTEFDFVREDSGLYKLTSSGPDRKQGTADDLVTMIVPFSDDTWDNSRSAFFLRKNEDKAWVLFHRWNGSKFKYLAADIAEKMSGNDLFDGFIPVESGESQRVLALLDQNTSERVKNPLILHVPADPTP